MLSAPHVERGAFHWWLGPQSEHGGGAIPADGPLTIQTEREDRERSSITGFVFHPGQQPLCVVNCGCSPGRCFLPESPEPWSRQGNLRYSSRNAGYHCGDKTLLGCIIYRVFIAWNGEVEDDVTARGADHAAVFRVNLRVHPCEDSQRDIEFFCGIGKVTNLFEVTVYNSHVGATLGALCRTDGLPCRQKPKE